MSPLLTRKTDLIYLTFFLIHIPVMFCVDLVPLYPKSQTPTLLTDLRTWYITTYQDQFFISPPAWFNFYMYLELLYHVPLSIWAVGAILRDDPKLPIHLLTYSVQTAITTATCIADYLSWKDFSTENKIALGQLYGPYLALSIFMGADMYSRLVSKLGSQAGSTTKKTN